MRAKLIDGCGFALQPAPTVVTLSDFVASPLACAQAAHPRAPADFHSARSKCATSRREMRKSWKRLASDPLDARSSAIDYQGTMAGLPSPKPGSNPAAEDVCSSGCTEQLRRFISKLGLRGTNNRMPGDGHNDYPAVAGWVGKVGRRYLGSVVSRNMPSSGA